MAGFLIIREEKLCDAPKPSTCHSGFLDVGRMSKLSRKKKTLETVQFAFF